MCVFLYVTTYTAAIICFIWPQWALASEYWFKSCLDQFAPWVLAGWRSLGLPRAHQRATQATLNTWGKHISWGSWGWFCQGSSQREVTCSNPELFNAKSPRKVFRKRGAVEIKFGSQKGDQWGWKCNTSKSLAWTKLRAMADKQQNIIHRDLAALEPHKVWYRAGQRSACRHSNVLSTGCLLGCSPCWRGVQVNDYLNAGKTHKLDCGFSSKPSTCFSSL